MTDRPIIFSGLMVRALLDGRKTQTRRVLKPRKGEWIENGQIWAHFDDGPDTLPLPYRCGDRLYVRESWAPLDALNHIDCGPQALACRGFYRADENTTPGEISRWRPSIHMPRWASRLTLTVTEVRAQRLQEISEADAVAEGINPSPGGWWSGAEGQAGTTPQAAYALLWNSLHGPDAWDANPWVVAVTFTVEHRNIDTQEPTP